MAFSNATENRMVTKSVVMVPPDLDMFSRHAVQEWKKSVAGELFTVHELMLRRIAVLVVLLA